MKNKPGLFASLALCAAVGACSMGPQRSEEYLVFSGQLENNKARLDECTANHARHFAATTRFPNEKIARAAWKKCQVYASNYCHAQAELDALELGITAPEQETIDWKSGREGECLVTLNETTRSALLEQLGESGD